MSSKHKCVGSGLAPVLTALKKSTIYLMTEMNGAKPNFGTGNSKTNMLNVQLGMLALQVQLEMTFAGLLPPSTDLHRGPVAGKATGEAASQ